jgi:Arc/MetJ-type ribon-helix-helix transcriptional regulator
MNKTTVYLPDDLKAALERTAAATRRSEAELIREGIRMVTEKERSPKPRLPLFASGDPELSRRVDEALAGFGEQ